MTTEGCTIQEELSCAPGWAPPNATPPAIPAASPSGCAALDHELALIDKLAYAPYFLTVWDIVRFAAPGHSVRAGDRRRTRRSATASASPPSTRAAPTCCSSASSARQRRAAGYRRFEHERREEVIQHVYAKYGRERAGLAATVISYCARSAVREVGKALGLSADVVGLPAGQVCGRWGTASTTTGCGDRVGPRDPTLRRVLDLTRQLVGFPRHLSQHVGVRDHARPPRRDGAHRERCHGGPHRHRMGQGRSRILGMLKVEKALGMLTCIRWPSTCFAATRASTIRSPPSPPRIRPSTTCCAGRFPWRLPGGEPGSDGQAAALRPRDFYDLVVEVAIVRPGPIQGVVHPYLRRRNGQEAVDFLRSGPYSARPWVCRCSRNRR